MSSKECWEPSREIVESANITQFMTTLNFNDVHQFHAWTTQHYRDFWQRISDQLSIQFKQPYEDICDLSAGIESPSWFKGAKMNIADSCFNASAESTALIYLDHAQHIQRMTFGELDRLSNRIADSLQKQGYREGDVIAIIMPMSHLAVAIYLGIIKMGGVVASVPDSFSTEEMSVRLRIAQAKMIFTQFETQWVGKKLTLYTKVAQLGIPTIVYAQGTVAINHDHVLWTEFLKGDEHFNSVAREPMQSLHILFSSGTTAEPKAIPWNHSTPVKAASDAFFHQNIKADDVLAWPTSLGWMMGPWLIFAAFINQAAIALYTDAPKDLAFGEFIQQAKVTMLGVVPTLVATWRQSGCMEGLDFSTIKCFSSTGECSNPQDMWYLMQLAGVKPVIEYCGGTEIGGAYISSTMVQTNYPSLFSTPTMGLNIEILSEDGRPATVGEVAILPPSIGLSTTLLNADHHKVYFANMPHTLDGLPLRRHGDEIELLENEYYMVLGRADDSMNLGGIKISAVEIERAIVGIQGILENAAIGVPPPNNGPSLLVIFASTNQQLDKDIIKKTMQNLINKNLNPLFKIHDVVFMAELPKTASNKIMRRMLRKKYSS